MRLVKHYIFNIKTKIPFSEWPEIVHRFMSENHLTSHRFLYFFEDILSINQTKDEALPHSSCAKILKDCPSLGEIRYHNGRSHNRSDTLWLSNIDQQDNFPESKLLPLMKKFTADTVSAQAIYTILMLISSEKERILSVIILLRFGCQRLIKYLLIPRYTWNSSHMAPELSCTEMPVRKTIWNYLWIFYTTAS